MKIWIVYIEEWSEMERLEREIFSLLFVFELERYNAALGLDTDYAPKYILTLNISLPHFLAKGNEFSHT